MLPSHKFRPKMFATVAAIGYLTMTLTACSTGPDREYAIPQSLCGTKIDESHLEDFLPTGKKITVKHRAGDPDTRHCDVRVDAKLIFVTTQSWWEDGSTTARFASGQTLDDPDKIAKAGDYLYSDYQAFGRVKGCENSKHEDQTLFTGLQAYGSKHRDADAMRQMITSYTKEVQTSQQCQ